MSGAINTAGKSRDDDESGFGQLARELPRHLHAGGRALSRTDDGNGRATEQFATAFDINHRWRCFYACEQRRIVGFDREHRNRTGALSRLKLFLGVGLRAESDRPAGAAAP